MRLRAVAADRLPFALPHAQAFDHARAKQKHKEQSRDCRPAGPEGDVAKYVQSADQVGVIRQQT